MAIGGIVAALIACIFAPTLALKPEAIIYVIAMGTILAISFSLDHSCAEIYASS